MSKEAIAVVILSLIWIYWKEIKILFLDIKD